MVFVNRPLTIGGADWFVQVIEEASDRIKHTNTAYLPTAREGNVFTDVCLSTTGLMNTGSLLGLVTTRSVRILLECFLV